MEERERNRMEDDKKDWDGKVRKDCKVREVEKRERGGSKKPMEMRDGERNGWERREMKKKNRDEKGRKN